MASMLHQKWITTKAAAAPEDLKRCSFSKGLGPLLESLDKKIDEVSEKDAPTDKDKAELTKLFTKYQGIAADYLKQILKANEKYPTSGKSWLTLHEGLKKTDFLLVDMLKQDAKIKATKLTGFKDKSSFQVAAPEQPESDGESAAENLEQYNEEGFEKLAGKVKGGADAAARAKALFIGLDTCIPHNKTLIAKLKPQANAFSQQVARFETQLASSDFVNAPTSLQGALGSAKSFAAALPPQGRVVVQELSAILKDMDTRLKSKTELAKTATTNK